MSNWQFSTPGTRLARAAAKRSRVAEFLVTHGSISHEQAAELLQLSYPAAAATLRRMARNGELRRREKIAKGKVVVFYFPRGTRS